MRSINNIVLLACLLFCFSACRKNESVKAGSPGTANFTMQNVTGELKIAFVKDALTPGYMEIMNDKEDQKLREYLAAGYPETAGTIVKLMNFHVTGDGERRYLIFEGYNKKTKSNRSFAYPIVLNEDGISASFAIPGMTVNGRLAAATASESHSCSGIPCSCCAFVYSGSNIIGCQCNGGYPGCEFRSGDFCSHSVSGGTNPPPGGGTNPPGGGTGGGGTGGGGVVPAWGQCGGQGYTGAIECVAGYTCKMVNIFYSQCVL